MNPGHVRCREPIVEHAAARANGPRRMQHERNPDPRIDVVAVAQVRLRFESHTSGRDESRPNSPLRLDEGRKFRLTYRVANASSILAEGDRTPDGVVGEAGKSESAKSIVR